MAIQEALESSLPKDTVVSLALRFSRIPAEPEIISYLWDAFKTAPVEDTAESLQGVSFQGFYEFESCTS